MSDTKLNQYIQYGTSASRAAYIPDPPQVAGVDVQTLYIWYEDDTGDCYVWDGSNWQLIGGTGISIPVFHPFLLMGG